MAIYFFDTSALVKLYVRERGSTEALALTENLGSDKLAVLDLTAVEARAAVRRRERQGDITAETTSAILSSLQRDLAEVFLTQSSNADVVKQAIRLLDLYPLKAYDAVQLAGCLVLSSSASATILVSSDRQMLFAAEQEGVPVINPESSV